MNNLRTILVIAVVTLASVLYSQAATIFETLETDTIGTFRTNVNQSLANLNSGLVDATSTLGDIANLATSTGNLIVGSSSVGWVALSVGANAKILTASSTAPNGISWEGVSALTNFGGIISSISTVTAGTNITLSTTTSNLTINTTTTPVFTSISGTATTTYAKKSFQYNIVAATTSAAVIDPVFIFDATSTLESFWVRNNATTDFLTFNLYYSTSSGETGSTSSLNKILTSNHVLFSNVTSTKLTAFTSSTPPRGSVLFLDVLNASTSYFTMTGYYHENK